MRPIDTIVVHCSATKPSMDIGSTEIRGWHKAKGWSDIGYHYVIRRSGATEIGRDIAVPGAHVEGYNKSTIGICLIGGVNDKGQPEANFTFNQYSALNILVKKISDTIGYKVKVCGHRDFPGVKKACPSFDVKEFFK